MPRRAVAAALVAAFALLLPLRNFLRPAKVRMLTALGDAPNLPLAGRVQQTQSGLSEIV
jgi:hypothetical protein